MNQLRDLMQQLLACGCACSAEEPMSRHTSFRIGGPADLFVTVHDEAQLCNCLRLCREREIPYFLLGNGSNLLVSDDGVAGVVIQLGGSFCEVRCVEGNTLICGAGAKLTAVCLAALHNDLSGMEFAYGIPGTVGGAVYMNAGAYGGEIKQVFSGCRCMDACGNVVTLSAQELQLGYRSSILQQTHGIVTEVTLTLSVGDAAQIKAQMDDLVQRRRDKQPLEFPSAGSTFKRPEGHFAGALIEQAGLKGYAVADAQVSEKHAGFVINRGNATCADVVQLVSEVQQKVLAQSGVILQPEICLIGRNASWN